MSSFALRPTAAPAAIVAGATATAGTAATAATAAAAAEPTRCTARPPLQHRLSDPQFSEQDLDDAIDMGEHVRWANLGEPIYAEKDLEIFCPVPQQSTLPVYFLKAWLPYVADTVFNSLFDARYRCDWDARHTTSVTVLEHRNDGDVLYSATRLAWPLADRDYVYHRRAKFVRAQHAFVVACQAVHHSSAPTDSRCVRVETYAMRLCIRATGTSSCDLYVEYEDDTHFCVPPFAVRWLLATRVPAFMHALRSACANYSAYVRARSDGNDGDGDTIPSQVVRSKSEAVRAAGLHPTASSDATSVSSSMGLERHAESTSSQRASGSSSSSLQIHDTAAAARSSKHRTLGRTRRREKHSTHSDGAGSEDTTGRNSSSTRKSMRLRSLLRAKTTSTSSSIPSRGKPTLKKTASAGSLVLPQSPSSFSTSSLLSLSEHRGASSSTPAVGLADDFVVAFHKQKIGLHLETDVFSNRVLVAHCEKESEAARVSAGIAPGMLVTSVNGSAVARMGFSELLRAVKTTARPLTLGFAHANSSTTAAKSTARPFQRFKEPKNVLKCLVARDERDLVCALRPLNEDASLSAVLKTDFTAPAAAKKRGRGGGSSSKEADCVVVPEGYLVYEIDDCYVLDLPFAEIAHLLRRNSEPRVVTFKAALAVEGDRAAQDAARSALSKRLSDVFKWRSYSVDDVGTTSSSSTCSSPYAASAARSCSERLYIDDPSLALSDTSSNSKRRSTQTVKPTESSAAPVPSAAQRNDSNGSEIKWGDASPGACLADYADVTITAANLAWAWEHVHLLKADERIFSAALLVHKLEAFLMHDGATQSESIAAAARTTLNAMHAERELLDRIKERNTQGLAAMREFNCEVDTDWQFGQTYVGVTTHWKPGDDGTVWLKLDGLVEGVDIFNTIAVIRETDLYSVWVPFCHRSELLQQTGHVDVVAYISVAFPLLQRDAVIKAFGINACYESRAILLLGKTEHESTLPPSVRVPKVKGWNADRMEMRGFRALIEPITRTKARVCIVANIDPKCPVPRSLLNFGIKKVAGILLYVVRKEAEKIEQAQRDGHSDNEHVRRIQRDPTQFYAWLEPLMAKWFDDQRCNSLPPPMALSSSSSDVQYTAAADHNSRAASSPRKPSRTSPFHHYHHHQHAAASAADADADTHSQSDGLSQQTTSSSTNGRQRMLIDYLYDFGIWPYVLMFIFSHVTAETSFLHVGLLKFVFTCTCTWFGVPGAFSWQTRRLKRMRRELDPLRRRCVVLAGLCDVLNSWFLRVWAHWLVCYVPVVVHKVVLLLEHQEKLLQQRQSPSCFDRTPMEVRESENFWLIGSAFLFASVVVAIQIVVNI